MFILTWAIFGAFLTQSPMQLEDGIYLRAASGPLVKIQNGPYAETNVPLGRKQTLRILKAELISQDNANTRFRLAITVQNEPKLSDAIYIIMMDGYAYQSGGSGGDNKISVIDFYLDDRQRAEQLANYFSAKSVLRRHPHHSIEVFFKPTQDEFHTGEQVAVVLSIKNAGETAVAFQKGGRNRADRDNQYTFSCRYQGKQVVDIGSSFHFGGISTIRILKPGEVFEDTVSLNKWFAFESPGIYEVLGSYYLSFRDPDADPLSFPPIIWEDYASADFTVVIH